MPYDLIIKEEAFTEIDEAFKWYQEQKDDLGYEFIDEVEHTYQKLIEDPERYGYLNHRYRRIRTGRFPYIIVYEIMGNTLVVFRVRHIKKKPL